MMMTTIMLVELERNEVGKGQTLGGMLAQGRLRTATQLPL